MGNISKKTSFYNNYSGKAGLVEGRYYGENHQGDSTFVEFEFNFGFQVPELNGQEVEKFKLKIIGGWEIDEFITLMEDFIKTYRQT